MIETGEYIEYSVRRSVWNSVDRSAGDSVYDLVDYSVRRSVWNSVEDSVMDSVRNSINLEI